MPLDQLLTALEREASRTAEHLLAEARAEAEQLVIGTEQEIAQRRDIAVAAAAREQRATIERAVAEAAHTARRDTLIARDELLTRVLEAVRQSLPDALDLPAYRASLPSRLAAAVACFDDGEPVLLHCPVSLLPALQAITAERTHITIRPRSDAGSGLRLTTMDGTIEVDDTLETRLTIARPVLARMALQLLEHAR